jgi:hypothetical protein
MILTEFGSLAVGGDRAQWFQEAFETLHVKFPAVKGVIFFHVANDNTTTYKSLDWSFVNDERSVRVLTHSIDLIEKRYGLQEPE